MQWRQVGRYEWELVERGFSGEAILKETNHGVIASIVVRNEDFDMVLLEDREFFESVQDGVAFLEERMAQDSY